MDLNRSPDICKTDENIPSSSPTHEHLQTRQTSEQGSIFGSEDDLSLGTDAQAFSSSVPSLFSPESSSISTGFHYESSNESTGNPGSHRVIKKLAQVGRIASSDSLTSDFSDFSRTSHDVSSLLNAMTVDPEEFLVGLGFAEPDMRTRIPDRFLELPSKAHGIDVEQYRRSLDTDDLYGSQSQESPVWSDPGSSRIPPRFIASRTEPINTVLSGGYSSVPLIYEPEEVPEESFDLMRHLRLNKPCHVTKGMFLEPLTEELEVSSVGSGTVRTKISRKLSNEEGTIVREESFEQQNVESELLLIVPVLDNIEKSLESRELEDAKVGNDSQIVVNLEADEGVSVSVGEYAVIGNKEESSSDAVNVYNYSTEILQSETSIIDHNKNIVSGDLATEIDEELTEFSPGLRNPIHLKVTSIIVQDSFELEEITSEDFDEKESSFSTDPEAGLNVKSSEKRLTRENSGESSGFEEMPPDKDSLSPNSSSPPLIKRLSADRHVIINDSRRPLVALLDPEMLRLAAEKARGGEQFLDEKSPRATFAQRRTRSLTKQRPIDEDTIASWAYSTSTFAPKDPADLECLDMKISHDAFTEGLGTTRTKEAVIDFAYSSSDNYVGVTDVDYNRTLKFECEKTALKESDNSFKTPNIALSENLDDELQNSEDIAITQSEFNSRLKNEVALVGEESISHLNATTYNISEQYITENKEYDHKKTDDNFPTRDSENNLSSSEPGARTGEETQLPCDLVAAETVPLTSTGAVGECAEVKHSEESQKALQKVDSDCQEHYLHEINVLEQSVQKYESTMYSGGPLDSVGASYYTKHMLTRITEETNTIQDLRLMINSELERMKNLLSERRNMLLAGAARDSLGSGVSQKMADLLREQSSLNIGLSNIGDELSIRRKASRRARMHSHIEGAKTELKEEREKCVREFREEIKEALVRELSERFSNEVDLLRREVRSKDAVIEQLKKDQEQREPSDKQVDHQEQNEDQLGEV